MGLQDILSYWLSQNNPQGGQQSPQVQGTRDNILNNFMTPNTYNTGDPLSSNYPTMNSATPALNLINTMSPQLQSQTNTGNPIPQLIRQMLANQSSGASQTQSNGLRADLFQNNLAQTAAPPASAPVDNTVRGMPDGSQQQTGTRNTTLQDIANHIMAMPSSSPDDLYQQGRAKDQYSMMLNQGHLAHPGADGLENFLNTGFYQLPTNMLGPFGMSPTTPVFGTPGSAK